MVQRYFPDVVGGSERLAGLWAQLLRQECSVEIWTSCARDTETWSNVLAPGYDEHEGISVRRFPVTLLRDQYWNRLHRRLVRDYSGWKKEPQTIHPRTLEWSFPCRLERWPLSLQMEWLRRQGPWTPALWEALLEIRGQEDTGFVLTPYLYATTVISALLLPRSRTFIAPALHDEPPAYLPLIRESLGSHRFLFLTAAERRLALEHWPGAGENPVIGLPVAGKDQGRKGEDKKDESGKDESAPPYVLYAGRRDAAKGVPGLVQAFARSDGRLALYLIGSQAARNQKYPPSIVERGIVSDEERRRLIRGAVAVAVPSRYESFSLIAIEAMAVGTVVLVNGQSPVLMEHIASGGGVACYTPDDYVRAAASLLDPAIRQRMSLAACNYATRFAPQQVKGRLLDALKSPGLNTL